MAAASSGEGQLAETVPEPPGEGQLAAAAPERRARAPELSPRYRRAYADAGQNPENPADWRDFDIGRVVRLFRTGGEEAHLQMATR